jgi:hypothetical protein
VTRHSLLISRRVACVAALLSWLLPLFALAAGRQLSIGLIDALPNAPTTYQMRDWRQVATDFDALAFDTTATGQYKPIVRIDNTPVSPQLTKAFGLPAYVGTTAVFSETGEPVHEAIASLGAVLGATLVGIDKSTGPNNWVSMSREYYINRNQQNIVLNTPFSVSGGSAWYDIYPNILYYGIADRYPGETAVQTTLNTIDLRFYDAVSVLTANGTAPNFNYTAYDFRARQPVYNGTWREPDMGLGMAWLQHAAYWRKKDINPATATAHLNAVKWSLAYYEQLTTNPEYEVLTPFGAYTAARMNAEEGGNYDIHKMVKWVFERSNARPTKIMISGEQWGGQDVGGLIGFTVPNTGSDVRGYAFSMNTFITAMPIAPLARYEDRYSRSIGKWLVNAASAARLFYSDAHSAANQSSEFWTGDPTDAIAYEGLRHHWLAANDSEELYAGGDPLTYNWGPQTDFSVYGSAVTGVFGSIIKTTNVPKILQLDLLATDFYHAAANPTYLYYNPYATNQSVNLDLGAGGPVDLYDAVANRFIARGVSGATSFNIGADEAAMLVVVPAGGVETRVGRQLRVNNVVIDYNASILADNLIRNPDVDVASGPGSNRPASWHYSAASAWSTEAALSPTRSLKLADTSTASSQEWRTYATEVPAGEDRTLQLRWFWKHDIAAGQEFRARLRLSNDAVTSLDLTNSIAEQSFVVTGLSNEFTMFETTIALPNGVRSFDLTFITGGANSATGTIYIDDISAALVTNPVLAGDYNDDGLVDAADYTVWRDTLGATGANLPADGDGDQIIGPGDYQVWRTNFGAAGATALSAVAVVPEPSAIGSLATMAIALVSIFAAQRRR